MANGTRNQQVSLGCGTLIVIALIVMFFSSRNNDDTDVEIQRLKYQINDLKTAVETQTSEIKSLREKLEKPPATATATEAPAREK